ncbi:RnfH family protein [Chitinimonas arctica]|uniref:UPF0125 protein FNU76_00980 n=1 Tax=Chitinimonas arctica TaxID=2594795 RepID=A0A516SA55_9NEIS|nr:RnfH family protein [Chitinimonas arctica]QDQ25036.1 RnfH family protein [Chitinimonas arctica]
MSESIEVEVEVVYADPARQLMRVVRLPLGATVAMAIDAAALATELADVDLAACPVGIFGQVCARTKVLRQHDRVELYRPLIADPKDARHRRVALGKTMKKAD